MTKTQTLIIALLAVTMAIIAMALGNWSQQLNPEGIAPHSTQLTESDDPLSAEASQPRNAFYFGASMGLLAGGLIYCVLAFALLIRAKSYVVDDYFY